MGNVSDPANAAAGAVETNQDDRAAWVAMGQRGSGNYANFSKIHADDAIVDEVAMSVIGDTNYSLTPDPKTERFNRITGTFDRVPSTVNSNSAAFAVGNVSSQIASGDPNARVDRRPFTLALPGVNSASKVSIRVKCMQTGTRITPSSC